MTHLRDMVQPTTLMVAERLGRIGFGIEYLADRVAYIRSNIHNKNNIVCGSSLALEKHHIPAIDFSITSPPYMSKNDHKEYPFAAYQVTGEGYEQYLIDIQKIYAGLKTKLKPNARVVIEVSNIIYNGMNTTLAWDVARVISEALCFEKEIVVGWKNTENTNEHSYGFGYDHSYCLVFRND